LKTVFVALRHPEPVSAGGRVTVQAGLTERGRVQAAAIGDRIAATITRGTTPLVLHVRGLERTRETAEIVAQRLHVPFHPGWPFDGPADVSNMAHTTKYANAGVVVGCGSQPAIIHLLRLTGHDPGRANLGYGCVHRFEVDSLRLTIRYLGELK
jgi:phosphohistidine phosphatase SixA